VAVFRGNRLNFERLVASDDHHLANRELRTANREPRAASRGDVVPSNLFTSKEFPLYRPL
jgi:hypothetical protein